MITTYGQARILNTGANQTWFTPSTMGWFGTLLRDLCPAPYGAYFAYTNTKAPSGPEHKVAYINDAGYVNPSYSGVGSGHLSKEEFDGLMNTKYASPAEANEAARTMAREAWARK